MTGFPSDDEPRTVPGELLRAGVYVPESHADLREVVREVRDEEDPARALRGWLAASPVLLDEAVRRLTEMASERRADALLVAEAEDLLLAAPVARQSGLPLRRPRGRSIDGPEDDDAPGGERGIGISALHVDRGIQEAVMEAYRQNGGRPLGWLALAGRMPEQETGSRWSAVSEPGGEDTD